MKRYRITMPTQEQCTALGIKFDGMTTRTQLWLMGVCSGINFVPSTTRFNLILAGRSFVVETNSERLIKQVEDYLAGYGCKVSFIIPNCPVCNGQRELSGIEHVYYCGFCGTRTT